MLISTIKIQKNRHIAKHFHLLCADLFMNPVYKGTFSVPSFIEEVAAKLTEEFERENKRSAITFPPPSS